MNQASALRAVTTGQIVNTATKTDEFSSQMLHATYNCTANLILDHPCPPPLSLILNSQSDEFMFKAAAWRISDLVSNMCVARNTLCKLYSIIYRVSHRDAPHSNSRNRRKCFSFFPLRSLWVFFLVFYFILFFIFLVQQLITGWSVRERLLV